MNKLSLFSGIGGDDLASDMAGINTVCFVERDKYCQQILKKHWPDVPIIGDVKDVTKDKLVTYTQKPNDTQQNRQTNCDRSPVAGWDSKVRAESGGCGSFGVDIISGGFPCQPHSVAGKRKGAADERNLWPEFRRIVSEIKPRWVVAENVPGLFSSDAGRFFGVVLSDLASLGYSVGWCCYGAVDVGALHRRDRVFIVAYRKECRLQRGSDTRNGGRNDRERLRAELARSGAVGFNQPLAYPPITGLERAITEGAASADGQPEQCGDVMVYAEGKQSQSEQSGVFEGGLSRQFGGGGSKGATESTGQFESQLGMLVNGFSGWLAEPDIPRVATGVKDRVNKLKALGNAVVPQQIYPIYKAIVDIGGIMNAFEPMPEAVK